MAREMSDNVGGAGREVTSPDGEKALLPPKVIDGPELRRVLAVPRRPMPDPGSPESEALAAALTERFRLRPDGDLFPGPLRPSQALALRDAWTAQGGFCPMGVGSGKRLVAALLFSLFDLGGVYLTMGADTEDAELQFAQYRRSWKMPAAFKMRVLSYEILSNRSSATRTVHGRVLPGRLERLRPKIIVADEAHKLSPGSACAKRVADYLKAFPDTIFIALTGTPFRTSLNDAAHVLSWSLGANSPLPRDFLERMAWAGALDAGGRKRVALGALRKLGPGISTPSDARRALGLRILETPGVIGTPEPPLDTPLTIEEWGPVDECPQLNELFERVKETWTLDDGTEISDPLEMARHERTLGMGYWTRFCPEPPASWRDARNTWAKFVRDELRVAARKKIYTEGHLREEIEAGNYPRGAHELEEWLKERDSERRRTGLPHPETEVVWESDELIGAVDRWLDAHEGLVWVEHVGLGRRLAKEFGIPYYGEGGGVDAATGRNIREHPGGSAIASFAACGTGKNLQGFWSKNLWLGVAPNEQSLARTHRPGQKADVVRNWVYLGCGRHLASFVRAADVKAAFAGEILLTQQKLELARISLPTASELEARGHVRWTCESMQGGDE